MIDYLNIFFFCSRSLNIIILDRRPRYRRPPSKLYPDILWKKQQQEQGQQEKKPTTSLAQLSQRPRTSALQSLANRNNPTTTGTANVSSSPLLGLAKKNNSETAKRHATSSLQSLAQKSAAQRGKSALQSLASRQQQTTSTTVSQPKPSPLAALAKSSTKYSSNDNNNNNNNSKTGLAHLATRTATMKSSQQTNKLSGLAGLAKKQQQPLKQQEQEQSRPEPKEQSKFQQQQQLTEKKEGIQTTTIEIKNQQPKISIPITANPLCAPPSAAATFLFKRNPNKEIIENNNTDVLLALPDSVGQAFYEAMKKASAENIHIFSFNDPSPDDVVLEAQSHRSGGRKL